MIVELVVAFVATFAFAVIFDVSRSELIFCGVTGLVAQGIYLIIMSTNGEEALAVLAAAATVTVLSRTLANVRKMPVTVYLISGIIPLVPGAKMYNAVFNIIASDYRQAASIGIDAIKIATAIAIGIILIFALPNRIFLKRRR